MELPSMVQRSGDTLIVRSVVSGNQLYLDQGAATSNGSSSVLGTHAHTPSPHHHPSPPVPHGSSTSALEQHLERCRAVAAAAQHQQYQQQQQQQQQNVAQQQAAVAAATAAAQQQALVELKDEGLPQCKIKRNYSCNYCTYFTQNPRYHLTHLRDVHGEKIVINKCKLCLYASRHFQKLVRHMKMVHGCTDGISGSHGQSRGKRGMSREARRRKLEQSVGLGVGVLSDDLAKVSSYEQAKHELELQRGMQAFKQQEDKKQQLSNIFAAYERELLAQQERELEAVRLQHKQQQQVQNSYEQETPNAVEAQRRQTPPTNNNNSSGSSNANNGFQRASPQELAFNKSLLKSPSPTGSASPAGGAGTPQPLTSNGLSNSTSNLTLSYVEEPSQNRLLKCSVCDFTTLFRTQLVDHELDEHCKTKFFRCEKCSYVTHIKARFSKHVKYHSMPMIKCVTCDFRTPYKWNLDRHMKNHGGAGPFKCAACDFTADIKQSLTVHEMNHHVPPVGHAAGMSLARRRNKVGGTDLCDDFLSDSAELEDHYNNNNLDDYDDALLDHEPYSKRSKYDDDEPTDLSQKGGSSDTSSVHNHAVLPLKAKRPLPNLIPIPKPGSNILNLSKDFAASRSSLTEIASMFFNEKQISEMLQPLEKADAAQLSPTTTITSMSSQNSRNLLQKKSGSGSFFDKLKSSALASGGPNENLICPCGHTAKCLSESIIHRKACNFAAIADDDIEEEQDDSNDRLEIDFADDDDKQSHSALNLSVTGSTRCQHCRHRCKSSADLLNHLAQCREASRCGNESYDSMSGESSAGRMGHDSMNDQHPMENRVFIWNKMPRPGAGRENSQSSEGQAGQHNSSESATSGGSTNGNANTEENSYYGVETAPGYGEVTKKMTSEEEAANSSLKKVYKCPHCTFWASTASRFHVHIVGHLNKKPFECSLCSYRSNWRWDITKHIRLKTIRDPSHKNARVLMNDETGRRNYTKYNKYITLMKVTEEDGDPKLMKSGEMTPNQVASLSFLNDFNKNVANVITGTHLNGIKDDITLEPVPTKSDAESQLSEGFIRLPLLATMVNAAMAQHQQQQKEQEQATMITPSVTISAVKRSPPPLMKASDDLVTDVKQEGNEKRTFYKCRKCSFRHANRDAVLAHVKIHYQDSSYPIITATATGSPKSAGTPLQVVNSSLYMNKVLAAMCLSQQQQQPQQSTNSSSSSAQQQHQQQQHSMLSAGLLQQAIQNSAVNSPHSGLALALAGKNPSKASATASILEHGEQKASHNEASAQTPTSPMKAPTCLSSSSSSSSSPAANQLVAMASSVGVSDNSSSSGGGGSAGAVASPSLQHLLTSPRSTYNSSSSSIAQRNSNQCGGGATSGGDGGGVLLGTNSDKNLVMGALSHNNNNNSINNGAHMQHQAMVAAAAANATTTMQRSTAQQPQSLQSSPASSPSLNAAATAASTSNISTIVTTLPTTPTRKTTRTASGAATHMQMGYVRTNAGSAGASTANNARLIACSSPNAATTAAMMGGGSGGAGSGIVGVVGGSHGHGDSVCIDGLVYGSNNSTLITSNTTTSTPSTTTTNTTQNSCNLLLNAAQPAAAATNTNTSSSPSSLSSSEANNNTSNCNHANNNGMPGEGERGPMPYRCGICHQLSNWKHVIQRHCRLKHGGDIRIETLDRSSVVERDAPPIYRPLGAGASNESAYGLTLKALQHQQQQNPPPSTHLNNNPSNQPTNLLSKAEQLLHSPLAGTAAAANAAHTPQDLKQAAAAFLAYKAAAAAVNSGQLSGDELLLHQQLQQNDQIEITRLPASNNSAAANAQQQQQQQQQQNSKCKQQKCPLCPYISESKSQMNYHISLHKPTQYECNMCTFVCAKKQHLNSHMRSVHQQHTSANLGTLNTMDYMALQFAVAQYDPSALTAGLDLSAIDLTALKHSISAQQQQNAKQAAQQQSALLQASPPVDIHTKPIFYCPKCPAMFAPKPRETQSARADLEDHLKCHGLSDSSHYLHKCEFCDLKTLHEPQLQKHRYVHSQQYQDKVLELYRSCREDIEYPAPKLMQITLTKNLQAPETVWIVDNELSEQGKQQQPHQQQQHANISSSTNAHFDNANSLLKKQLESGPVIAQPPRSSVSPKQADNDDSSNMPSTSASVATSDLAVDGGSDFTSSAASPAPLEKCPHCPYETKNSGAYKAHLQHHICISNQTEAYTCEHCDYTDAEQANIEEHTRVHFNALEKLKSVAFFTSYDNLELSVEQQDEDEKMEEDTNNETIEEQEEENAASETNANASNGLPIKQEHNNNNEENAINENTVQEQKDKQEAAMPNAEDDKRGSVEPIKKPCNKIILYKNDGCLSIKRDNNNTSNNNANNNNNSGGGSSSAENISDRLRRRISRNSSGHMNGVGSSASANGADEQGGAPQQNHKTILVNAKTGQVISRN